MLKLLLSVAVEVPEVCEKCLVGEALHLSLGQFQTCYIIKLLGRIILYADIKINLNSIHSF